MNIRKGSIAAIFISVILFHAAAIAQTDGASKNLPNFHRVSDSLYRGGQPKDAGFAELKAMKIATVIDLRGNDKRAVREKALVESAGMRFISLPLGNWNRPGIDAIKEIVAKINAPENQPVFVHCKRGSDRTGTVIAIYRMTADGKTAKEATKEAADFDMGWWQFGMRDFLKDYYRDYIQKNEKRN